MPAELHAHPYGTCYEQVLLELLGVNMEDPSQLPIADCLYLDATDAHQVCAQPVHFDASHDNARLLPGQCLQITQDEADAIAASLNALWNPDNIQLSIRSTTDWRLTGQDATPLNCLPVSILAFKSVAEAMPRSENAAAWRQLFTEAQMLLHDHPVNLARQERGLRTVNGIWFYGGARLTLPHPVMSCRFYSADQFTQGLAKKLSIACHDISLQQVIAELAEAADLPHAVIVDTRLQQAWLANDNAAFLKLRLQIEQHLLQPVAKLYAGSKQFDYCLNDCQGNHFKPASTSGISAKLKAMFSTWR